MFNWPLRPSISSYIFVQYRSASTQQYLWRTMHWTWIPFEMQGLGIVLHWFPLSFASLFGERFGWKRLLWKPIACYESRRLSFSNIILVFTSCKRGICRSITLAMSFLAKNNLLQSQNFRLHVIVFANRLWDETLILRPFPSLVEHSIWTALVLYSLTDIKVHHNQRYLNPTILATSRCH